MFMLTWNFDYQLEGFREFLRGRDTLQAALEKAEKEKIKLLEDKTKAASGSSSTMSFFSKGASSLVRHVEWHMHT